MLDKNRYNGQNVVIAIYIGLGRYKKYLRRQAKFAEHSSETETPTITADSLPYDQKL